MGPEGDIAPFTAGEVAVVQSDVIYDWVGAVAVLPECPVHFILYCCINAGGHFL